MIKLANNINQSQRLFIELGTALLLEPETRERAVSSQLIGMRVGNYLIVNLTENNWNRSRFKAGETLTAKYILSDDVFGFETRIVRAMEDPDYLLFLDYPDEVKSCNIRSERRVECFLPVNITLGDESLQGIITNINRSGCLCKVDDCPGDTCPGFEQGIIKKMTLEMPYGQFDTLTIHAAIRSVRVKDPHTFFGLLFEDLDSFSQKVLSTLVPALKI